MRRAFPMIRRLFRHVSPSLSRGNAEVMQPGTSSDSLPIFAVREGMVVLDDTEREVGTVTAIQPPGTDARPDAPVGVAEHLMGGGYVRIDGSGFLTNDVYVAGDQIDDVDDGVVSLRVRYDDLYRAAD